MATASTLATIARSQLGDSAGDHLTDSNFFAYLNAAQKKFVSAVWPLERRKGFTATAKQDRFTFPSELIILEGVWLKRDSERELDWVDAEEYRRRVSNLTANSGEPRIYTIYEREVRVWPRFDSNSANSTLASESAGDSATT